MKKNGLRLISFGIPLAFVLPIPVSHASSSACASMVFSGLNRLVQGERESEPQWSIDSFGFNESAFGAAKKLLASDPVDLRAVFVELKKVGLEYEIRFTARLGIGSKEEFSGTVNRVSESRDGSAERDTVVYIDTGAGTSEMISISSIVSGSVRIAEKRVPAWVFDEARKTGDLARDLGIRALSHILRYPEIAEESLFTILKTRRLESPPSMHPNSVRANYLSLNNGRSPDFNLIRSGDERILPIIEFETSLLNRSDYLINQCWACGRYSNGSIRADETTRLRRFLFQFGSGQPILERHEVVFENPISIEDIRFIFLPEAMRLRILRRLEEEKILPPTGKTWESFLKAGGVVKKPI